MGSQTTDYETWYFRQIPWADEPVPDLWHAAWYQSGTAVCGSRARLSATEHRQVKPGVDFTDVDQSVCRRCLNYANRAAAVTRRDTHG